MSNGTTVVGVDGSPSSKRALDWAARRVAERGGRLRLLCVVDLLSAPTSTGHSSTRCRTPRGFSTNRRVACSRTHPALDVQTGWVDGRPVSELVKASATAELVVIGTDKSPDDVGPRVGTLPLSVAARSHCAVAVIPDLGSAHRRGVVVGIDRSPQSHAALAVAVREACWSGTPVRADSRLACAGAVRLRRHSRSSARPAFRSLPHGGPR